MYIHNGYSQILNIGYIFFYFLKYVISIAFRNCTKSLVSIYVIINNELQKCATSNIKKKNCIYVKLNIDRFFKTNGRHMLMLNLTFNSFYIL